MKILKRIGIGLLSLIGILLVVIIGYVGYMQMHYYRISDNRKLTVKNNQAKKLSLYHPYSIITYNVSFGAYNHNFDFFMDKGELKNGKKRKVPAVPRFLSNLFLIRLMVLLRP